MPSQTKNNIGQLYDVDGNPIELDDVQRVNLVCFKCTDYIENNFATLTSPPNEKSSDNVSERTSVELCKNCYHEVMRFCGSVED